MADFTNEEDDDRPAAYGHFLLADTEWRNFHFAAQDITAKLGVSRGISHRMLRELCASGDVRAILVSYRNGMDPRPIRLIKPSEWRTTELDMEDCDLYEEDDEVNEEEENGVEVSQDDLEYWLAQQAPETAPQPMDRRDEAIALRLRKGEAPPTTMPWKKCYDLIRHDIGAKPTDHGCSDVTIEKMTRPMMRRFGR
jgi:hypothetical protein